MLGKAEYYHGTVRKIVASFGSIFNDITIDRVQTDASVIQNIKVPLSYGGKEKYFARVEQDPLAGSDDQAAVGLVLPRMSFEITGMRYDSSRKLPSRQRTVNVNAIDNTTLDFDYNSVPYNIDLTLSILTDHMEDGLRIVEQILPQFRPDYTVTIVDIPELNIRKDITIQLNNVTPSDEFTGLSEDRTRITTWTLDFVAKANIYPPTENEKAVLDPTVNMFDDTGRPGKASLNVDIDPTTAKANEPYTTSHTITVTDE